MKQKISNASFRFYKWPTKAKRGSKKLIHSIISPFACHSSFQYMSTPLLRPSDVLRSLLQMLLVPSQIPFAISQLPEVLSANGPLFPLEWGVWSAWKVMPCLSPMTLCPCFWEKQSGCGKFVLQSSLWDQVEPSLFLNPHPWLSSSPGLSSFSLPSRFPPIKYSYKSPISGADFREWDQNYSFN